MRKYLLPMMAAVLSVCMIFVIGATYAVAETSSYVYQYDDMFTKRDLKQTADLTNSVEYSVEDGQDIHITSAGVYVLSGSTKDATIYVEAGKDDKVQLVLDGLSITNSDAPAIYVKTADKVFVTVSDDSILSVTDTFDSRNKADGVIYSKSDLVMNGDAALTVSSTENGVLTTVTALQEDERLEEIARMLSGAQITEAARIAARTLWEKSCF